MGGAPGCRVGGSAADPDLRLWRGSKRCGYRALHPAVRVLSGVGRGGRLVHALDVAGACVAALRAPCANRAYNLSGGETLSYREMVERVFGAMGRRPRVVSVPAGFLRV